MPFADLGQLEKTRGVKRWGATPQDIQCKVQPNCEITNKNYDLLKLCS